MTTDLRCFTFHFFFEIKDAELYGGIGSTGYAKIDIDEAVNTELFTAEHFVKASENLKRGISKQLSVPVENVTSIHRDIYKKETESEEEDEDKTLLKGFDEFAKGFYEKF